MTTWDELSLAQQTMLKTARNRGVIVATDKDGVLESYEWPHVAFERLVADGYLEQFGVGTSYHTKYLLTPAGRALLPTAETSAITTIEGEFNRTQLAHGTLAPIEKRLESAYAALEADKVFLAEWKERAQSAEADLAAALARAQAAEGEAAQLRQFKQDQTRVVTVPSADADGYSEETVLLSDMLSAENTKLEAENARLRQVIDSLYVGKHGSIPHPSEVYRSGVWLIKKEINGGLAQYLMSEDELQHLKDNQFPF